MYKEHQEAPLLGYSDTINPYRQAAYFVFDRLKWDINPLSWSSRAKLKGLKNSYAGKKAVIVCNGPSLLKTDFSSLEGTYTFGLNKINLLFDRESYRPNAIVCVNHLVIDQNKDFYNETDIPLFLDYEARTRVKKRNNITFLHTSSQAKFARDVSISVWPAATVTNVALQLAYHMGFSKVGIIGCDHNFAEKGFSGKTIASSEKDLNHFDPRYFAGGTTWQLPNYPASEYGYHLARENFEGTGREIYNCTVGGKLEVFKRMELKDFLGL